MSILTQVDGHTLIVTLDRPEARNAIDAAMREDLIEVWRNFRDTDNLRVAIVTGSGTESFCAGADLKELGDYYASMTPIERREASERDPGLGGLTRNFDPRKPVIAAVNGTCLAGGLELALACDLRIAADHATFGLPEVARGIMPGAGGTQRLPRQLPLAVAREMIFTGRAIDADAALRWGLVSHLVTITELMQKARELARAIAANAPLAIRAARDAINQGLTLPLNDALRLEQFHAEPLRLTEDAREGLQAFIEKRTPEFKGK